MINYPFTDYNGNSWSESLVDTYNRYCHEVETRETRKLERDSLAWKELEFYRDQRHKQFIQCCEIASMRGSKR